MAKLPKISFSNLSLPTKGVAVILMAEEAALPPIAAALDKFTRPEPLPWTEFYIARGHALAAHGRGERGEETLSTISALARQANEAQLRLALAGLEACLVSGRR